MSLIYFVKWRCTTSCDLVRPSKIVLRYPTILGITARFLNFIKTPKTSGDDPWWLRRRVTSHNDTWFAPNGPRSPKCKRRRSSYGVAKAGVTVALFYTLVFYICSAGPCVTGDICLGGRCLGGAWCLGLAGMALAALWAQHMCGEAVLCWVLTSEDV